jgi:hypothetical protein
MQERKLLIAPRNNKLEKIIFVLHEHIGYRIFTAELARQAGS